MMKPRIRLRKRKSLALAAVFFLVAVAGLGIFTRNRIENIVAKPAPAGTPVSPLIELTAEEATFYDYVAPRMLKFSAEAEVLAQLGESKSRNIVELQTRGNRIDEYAGQISSYIASHPVPSRFAVPTREFFLGVDELQSAMENSKRGMITFDWNLVAAQIKVFEHGSAMVRNATNHIQIDAGSATPGHS
jgi:hypothetical protein